MYISQLVEAIGQLPKADKYDVVCAVHEQTGKFGDVVGGFYPLDEQGLDELLSGYAPSEIVRMSVFASGSNPKKPFSYDCDLVCIGDDGNLESWYEDELKVIAIEVDDEELAEGLLFAVGIDPGAPEIDEEEFAEEMKRIIDLDSDVIEQLTRVATVNRSRLMRRGRK